MALLMAMVSCAKPPLPPPPAHSVSSGALLLGSEALVDELDCPAGNCVHWYRVEVPRKGKITLYVEAFELVGKKETEGVFRKREKDSSPPRFMMNLDAVGGKSIANARSESNKEATIESNVRGGAYLVSVWSANPGRPFGYRLNSTYKPAPKPKKKKKPVQQYKAQRAMILESEGWGSDVEAVLIDLGSSDGMRTGLKGRLINEGEEIGKLSVQQVYPDGSRARVEGTLVRPLGPDSQAEIMVPIP
jgi:hypothetical protein